jgi:hypothetical protein
LFAKKVITDPVTGFEYRLLTDSAFPSHKMYFSSESWTTDDKHILFFRSAETGEKLIRLNEETGEDVILADAADGWKIHSFGLSREKDEGYIIKDDKVFALDVLTGQTKELAPLPDSKYPCGHYTSSKSGLLPMTFKLNNGIFCLALTDPAKGATDILYYSDTPLGHCQACPGDDNMIFFCHETGGDALQRMWHFDIAENKPFPYYVERWGEWITHETWSHDGSFMTFIKAPDEIWTGSKDGRHFRLVSKSEEYHHCAPSRSAKWITSDRSGSGQVALINVKTGKDTLLVTGHIPPTGAEHQHPSFNRKGDKILFTAPEGTDGACQIGLIDLKQIEGFKA